MKEKMAQADPIAGLLEQADQTLRSGHRVWVVGELRAVPPGKVLRYLPPAPTPEYGWTRGAVHRDVVPYVGDRIAAARAEVSATDAALGRPCNRFENIPLSVLEGWH